MQDFQQWIQGKDASYQKADIPPKQRPFEAWRDYSSEIGAPVRLDDPFVKEIFSWYKAQFKEGTFNIGCLFRGAFYFNGSVYAVEIPVFYGRVRFDMLKSLRDMKALQLKMLEGDEQTFNSYISLWHDCLDYGCGIRTLSRNESSAQSTVDFANSAIAELDSCVGEILQQRPNSTVIERARMAIEMFLKAALSKYAGYTEAVLSKKPYSHNLENLCIECQKISQFQVLANLLPIIKGFPSITDRYNKKTYTLKELFDYYLAAQRVGVMYVRSITGNDSRKR